MNASPAPRPGPSGQPRHPANWIGLVVAVPLALLVYWGLQSAAPSFPPRAQATAALAVLIGTLWITEALPLAATALLPLVLFPLTGVLEFKAAAAPYADYIVFIYLGGFMLALAIERWNVHRRFALWTLVAVGSQPARLVGGLMLATALISMWISNTASTAMMLPLGLSLVRLLRDHGDDAQSLTPAETERFATAMMLGIAYAATIGGLGTLIGTPTNTALAGFAEKQGLPLDFARWMFFATPLAAVYLLLAWILLAKCIYRVPARQLPDAAALVRRELAALGPLSRGEWAVLLVFAATALLWLVREPLTHWPRLVALWPQVASLNDGMIALAGAFALFVIPVDPRRGIFVLDWETANKLPWGVLLLFGGGLSLAEAMKQSGLTDALGQEIAGLGIGSPWAMVVLVTAAIIFASEFTSNVATVQAFLPVMLGVASGLGCDPMLLLVATGLAASCAFMLPVGTPPNAIVFGTGLVRQSQMMTAGLTLNLLGIVLIPLAIYTLGAWILGIGVR